jgi:hypothetical protein
MILYRYLYDSIHDHIPLAWKGFFNDKYTQDILKRISDVLDRVDRDDRRDYGKLLMEFYNTSIDDVRVLIIDKEYTDHVNKRYNLQGIMKLYSCYTPTTEMGNRIWRPFIITLLTWIDNHKKDICILVRDLQIKDNIEITNNSKNLIMIPKTKYMMDGEIKRQNNECNKYFRNKKLPMIDF